MAEDNRKFIIANLGHAGVGKSPSIKKVYNILAARYPHNLMISGYDIKGTITINGILVGIESQGDPGCRMPVSMDEFVAMGCNIIYTACRTRSTTLNKVFELHRLHGYEVIYAPNPRTYYKKVISDASYEKMNDVYAEGLANIIEDIAMGRI